MKINIKQNICPSNQLPDGYTVTLIDINNLTQHDKDNWYKLQLQRENVKTHDQLLLPERGVATFAKYYGKIVACGMMKHISSDILESGHIMVLPDHRRKGIFKALVSLAWMDSYLKWYTWINLSPVVQVNFWKRNGAEMGWAK